MKTKELSYDELERMIILESEYVEVCGYEYNALELLRDHDPMTYRKVLSNEIIERLMTGVLVESEFSSSGCALILEQQTEEV